MSRPSKPASVIESERKSHRTKSEMQTRKDGEQSLLSGKKISERPEVKNNPEAHKEFKRINSLLAKIEKNDAIYENVINRYCQIYAECLDFEVKRESFYGDMRGLAADKNELIESGEMTLSSYYATKRDMQNSIISLDRQIQSKRKMLFDIERDNAMTIAAALRNIPKKAEKNQNALLEALNAEYD
jgi:phage terminase small subunit